MSINNKIEALSIRNTATKAVNMTEFNNPFLLLSSTKALNELVVNTNPSSRAKVANIEPTKSKFQQNPLGVPIDVYTKDTATGAKVPKLKGADLMAARNARAAKRRAFITANKQKRDALPAPLPVITTKPPNKVPPKRGPGRPKSDKKPSEATVVKRPVGRPKSDKKPSEGDKPKRPVGRPKNTNPKPDKPKRPVGRPKKSTVVAPKQRAGGGSYETAGLGGF